MRVDDASKGTDPEAFLAALEGEVARGVARIRESTFFSNIVSGVNVREQYVAYLREAYHFVRMSSAFTPLSARRMDPRHFEVRQWILHHSGEELGHERMALADLGVLGVPEEAVTSSAPGPGTVAWVSFFYYQVAVANPFASLGVLFFLESMAAGLAPVAVKHIVSALPERERAARTFLQEHGTLDVRHSDEQRELLRKYCLAADDQRAVLDAAAYAAPIKRFFFDCLAGRVAEGA
jgi:pyrroloquinoline quinone (PQQ) biosynthesis protein C